MSNSADFGVNGRYLTQSVTGVQRYARNVIADERIARPGKRADTDRFPFVGPRSGFVSHATHDRRAV
jgi:hypothetical protein